MVSGKSGIKAVYDQLLCPPFPLRSKIALLYVVSGSQILTHESCVVEIFHLSSDRPLLFEAEKRPRRWAGGIAITREYLMSQFNLPPNQLHVDPVRTDIDKIT